MADKFLTSDPHYSHPEMLIFKGPDGVTPLRPFSCVEEMDEALVNNFNRRVGTKDSAYILGDITMKKKYLPILDRLNGKKYLVFGNHDIFHFSEYAKYFVDMKSYYVLGDKNILLSHIPVAIESRGRYGLNCHGHLHANVNPDPFYYNVCVEQFDYYPVAFDDVLKYIDRFIG